VRAFKLSNDPKFAEKLKDVVGLYVDPPAHAVVLSIDEKSQIQALDRTQPGLPMKKGRRATMTHDYKRNGTTTLFALDILEGKVIGRCMRRHRHQEFIRFLNAVEHEVPAGKAVHVVLDNYATHKHPRVTAWLKRHQRFTFHFTPTSCSWANAVEVGLPSSPGSGSSAACSPQSSNFRPPSTASSPTPTASQSRLLEQVRSDGGFDLDNLRDYWMDNILECNAPFYGAVVTIDAPLACYRMHDNNLFLPNMIDHVRFARTSHCFTLKLNYLARRCRKWGYPV
jgi:hypothetical protein